MTTEIVVKRKGQITIPVEIRRKLAIEENTKLDIAIEKDTITIKKRLSIFDLAGSSSGKADVNELKKMLDQMRDEDA